MRAQWLSLSLAIILSSMFAATARADEIGPDEESCLRKSRGDACADPQGAAGTCASVTDPRGRTRLRCVASPEKDTKTDATKPKSGCATARAPLDGAALELLAICGAALALARKRARRA